MKDMKNSPPTEDSFVTDCSETELESSSSSLWSPPVQRRETISSFGNEKILESLRDWDLEYAIRTWKKTTLQGSGSCYNRCTTTAACTNRYGGVAEEVFRRESMKTLLSQRAFRKNTFDLRATLAAKERDTTIDSTNSSNSLPTKISRRKVGFGRISIREYPMIVGDNPSVSKGVPISIDWEHLSEDFLDVSHYEELRKDSRRTGMDELRMRPFYRDDMLRKLGFSKLDRQVATKDATITRKQRTKTMASKCHIARLEYIETIQRVLINILTLGSRRRKERAYMQYHAYPYLENNTCSPNEMDEKLFINKVFV